MRPAGNPAVIAPRFRPVALRPRLSTGLPRSALCNMPKRFQRHNPENSPVRAGSVRNSRNEIRAPESVKALLSRISRNVATPVAEQRQTQQGWREWLKNKLPPHIETRVTGVVERDGTLTLFAETAAWSARLRFEIADLETQIRERNPHIEKLVVKVMPRTK
jgi:predicted nucleic acid-binding Zn ribbon protein